MRALTGRCLCGAVTVSVAGAHDPRVGACHCGMCQRWSGGLFLAFEADAGAVTVAGPVVRYSSSSFSERAFCGTCGAHLWMRDREPDAPYELMSGLFDAARDWPLRSEIYTDTALASVRLAGDHSRATWAEYEAEHRHLDGGADG